MILTYSSIEIFDYVKKDNCELNKVHVIYCDNFGTYAFAYFIIK